MLVRKEDIVQAVAILFVFTASFYALAILQYKIGVYAWCIAPLAIPLFANARAKIMCEALWEEYKVSLKIVAIILIIALILTALTGGWSEFANVCYLIYIASLICFPLSVLVNYYILKFRR